MMTSPCTYIEVKWQDGPIRDGVNGAVLQDIVKLSLDKVEELLANKQTNCREYAHARTKLEEALLWLNKRRR